LRHFSLTMNRWIRLCLTTGCALPLHAAERLVWTGPEEPGRAVLTSVFPDTGKRTLRRVTSDGGGIALPDGTPDIRWAGWLPRGIRPGGPLTVGGSFGEKPVIEEWSQAGDAAPEAIGPWPVGPALQSLIEWRAFGVEERVDFQTADSRLVVRAKPGRAPAGAVSVSRGRLPDPAWVPGGVSACVECEATGTWRLVVESERGGSAPVTVELPGSTGTASIPLPALLAGEPLRFTLVAPESGGELQLRGLALRETGGGVADGPAPYGRWIWDTRPEKWAADDSACRELAVSYPAALEFSEIELTAIRALRGRNVRLVAVEGDPAMILPGEQGKVAARATDLRALPEPQRPDALQFDIEPYLLPGYSLDPACWNREWLATLRGVKAAAGGLPVEAVLPWWLVASDEHAGFLNALPEVVDRVVVMNYRTQPMAALQSASRWMEWGARHGRPVAMAVEFGPLPDVEMARYVAAERGDLWLVESPGQGTLALLLASPAAPPPGAFALRRDGEPRRRTPDGVTFHRDPEAARPLIRVLGALQPAVPGSPRPVYLHEPPRGFSVGE